MAIATNVRLGVTLEAAALEQYVRAVAAGCPLGVTSDFRDPDLQVQLFHENYTRDYDTSAKYDARKWGSVTYWRRHYNIRTGGKTVSVAVPGSSRHEKGLALDLPGDMNDAATPRGWMHAFGRPFGWYWPSWARQPATREEWHVEFDPTLITRSPQEDDVELKDTVDVKAASPWAAEQLGKDTTTVEHLLAQAGHAANATRALAVAGDAKNAAIGANQAADKALAEIAKLTAAVKALAETVAHLEVAGIDVPALVKAINDDAARRLAN